MSFDLYHFPLFPCFTLSSCSYFFIIYFALLSATQATDRRRVLSVAVTLRASCVLRGCGTAGWESFRGPRQQQDGGLHQDQRTSPRVPQSHRQPDFLLPEPCRSQRRTSHRRVRRLLAETHREPVQRKRELGSSPHGYSRWLASYFLSKITVRGCHTLTLRKECPLFQRYLFLGDPENDNFCIPKYTINPDEINYILFHEIWCSYRDTHATCTFRMTC